MPRSSTVPGSVVLESLVVHYARAVQDGLADPGLLLSMTFLSGQNQR